MKCLILFSGKNKKNNIILSSAENAQRVVKVKNVERNVNYNCEKNKKKKYLKMLSAAVVISTLSIKAL